MSGQNLSSSSVKLPFYVHEHILASRVLENYRWRHKISRTHLRIFPSRTTAPIPLTDWEEYGTSNTGWDENRQALDAMMATLFGTPASQIRVPGFKPGSAPDSGSLLLCNLGEAGDSRQVVRSLLPTWEICAGWCSWITVSARFTPGCFGHVM